MSKRILFLLLLAMEAAAPAAASTTPDQHLQLAVAGGSIADATIADQAVLRPAGDFTIEAWVKADPQQSLSPYPIVLTKPAGNLLNGDCSYGFIVERANGHVHFRVTTTTGTWDAVGTGNLLDGRWHHLAGVRLAVQSNVISLVVDGVLVASRSITGSTLYTADALDLGASRFSGYAGNGLVGQIDEVRIWNVARSEWGVQNDREVLLNSRPGLVAVWHFDEAYAKLGASAQILDAVGGIPVATNGASLAPGSAPVSRSLATMQLDQLGPIAGAATQTWQGAVRMGGSRDLLWGTIAQPGWLGPTGWIECDVVDLARTPRVLGRLPITSGGPIVRMAARDSVVFCMRAVPNFIPTYWLRAMRVSDPAQLGFFGDSLQVMGNVKLLLDPANSNFLIAAGCTAILSENHLAVIDVTNAGGPVLLLDAVLDPESGFEQIIDVAKRGAYLYASFSDGTVRIFRYDVYTLNGNTIRTLTRTTGTITLGSVGHVAVSGTRLFVADASGKLRVYDLANPVAPVVVGTWSDGRAIASEIQVDGDRVGIAGPNGVTFVDAHSPASMVTTGYWCPDQPPPAGQVLTLKDNVCGLASGLPGYAVLAPGSAVTAVREGPAGLRSLAASPNPSRGRVDFAVPGPPGLGRIEILDVCGRHVRTIDRATWDGRDEGGSAVQAGVYLARWTAGRETCVARVAIVK